MTNLSETSLQAFERQNKISLVHVVVLVERSDFLGTILALNSIKTKHLDYEAPAAFNITPLALATAVGNINIVHQLINGGANLDGTSYLGYSPLHISIKLGHWKIAQSLISAGASPYYEEEQYKAKLLFEASMSFINNPTKENDALIVSLLKTGVNIKDLSAFINLDMLVDSMIIRGHKELIEQILLPGANLTGTRNGKLNLLSFTVTRKDITKIEMLEIVEILLKSGADPNPPPYFISNQTALSWASYLGDLDLVLLLLDWGSSTVPPPPLYSPLFMALFPFLDRTEDLQVVKVLMKHPFNPNFEDNFLDEDCRTTLSQAIGLGDITTVREMLRGGAEPLLARCSNATLCSLGQAMTINLYTEEEASEIMQAILPHRWKEINKHFYCSVTDNRDIDLLDYFMYTEYTEAVEMLLDSGVNIERSNHLIDKLSLALLSKDKCCVATKLLERNYPILPLSKLQISQGLLYLSRNCIETSRMILKKFPERNLNNLQVDIGDELVINLLPEHEHNVIVMNWKRNQWSSYTLDQDSVKHLNASPLNSTVLGMRVMAKYPHPFLLMTDFRIFILEKISKKSPDIAKMKVNFSPNVPDVFSLVKIKLSDIIHATQFYSPVLESLLPRSSQSWLWQIINHTFGVVLAMGALFLLLSVPVNATLVKYVKVSSMAMPAKKTKPLPTMKNNETNQCNCILDIDSSKKDSLDVPSNQFEHNLFYLLLPIVFYTAISITNLFTFQLAKKGINSIIKNLIRCSSYSSSLWIILIFKFLNTLIIDYQPGSACAGQLFNDQYNTKLAFFKNFNNGSEIINSFMLDKYILYNNYSVKNLNTLRGKFKNATRLSNCYDELQNENREALNNITENYEQYVSELENLIDTITPGGINYVEDIFSSIWFQTNDCDGDLYLDLGRQTAAALFQVIFIQIFLSNGIFSKIENLWSSNAIKNLCLFLLILLISLSTQVFNHMAYFKSSNMGIQLIFLLLFAPGSVLLEWVTFRLLKAYTERCFQLLTAPIRYFSTTMNEGMIILALSSSVHETEELDSVHNVVSKLLEPIQKKLEAVTRHKVEAVHTGSVFERFGKSLVASDALESNLKSDYDVMFALTKSSLQVKTLPKNDEFLHIIVLNDKCPFLNALKEQDQKSEVFKISAVQAKDFMNMVVRSSELEQQGRRPFRALLRNIMVFQVNLPRLSRCPIIQLCHHLTVDL